MKKILLFIFIVATATSCNKHDWLDVKSNKSDLVPKSLSDLQAILDNTEVMNFNYPELGFLGSDNYYLTYSSWQGAFTSAERNAYIWARDIFEGETCVDWDAAYKTVAYANIVLEGLNNITPSAVQQDQYNNAKGSALFYRAYVFYDLAELFAKPWDSATASSDSGIPLRLSADVNVASKRSSVQETYNKIIEDLKQAETLLPETPLYLTRPSKAAVEGLLARVYFNRRQYDQSLSWSEKYLEKRNSLLDFNSLDSTGYFKLPGLQPGNPEITFYSTALIYSISVFPKVDTVLYQSYQTGDLRRAMFFVSSGQDHLFTGAYSGSVPLFAGIATNEIMLINAESNARLGNLPASMDMLNKLLSKRYITGSFTPLDAASTDEAIDTIISERRKELPFTGNLRWQELRRLNTEPARSVTLTRLLNGTVYKLPPADNRYVYPIPPDEVKLSGLQQNPR
jgi:hypothetical protein